MCSEIMTLISMYGDNLNTALNDIMGNEALHANMYIYIQTINTYAFSKREETVFNSLTT